jgi:hypothetical protein
VLVLAWGSRSHESRDRRRDFDRIVTFCNGVFKNDVTESCPRLIRIHTAVTLEEDAKVGISRSINVWDNVVVEKLLVTATHAQANEGPPCCILVVD